MKYKQLTSLERILIASYRLQRWSLTKIADALGRHKSTISREIRRNRSDYDGAYRYSKAISKTGTRRRESRNFPRYSVEEYVVLESMIQMKWSPAQISRLLKDLGAFQMSHETIYRYIRRDRELGGRLHEHLRLRCHKLRKRHRGPERRGRLPDKRSIEDRPEEANDRSEIGHWEIDTVMGKGSKDCLLIVVERKTRFALVGKLENRTQKEVNSRLLKLIGPYRNYFKTITSGNGTEFHGYKSVEKKTGVKFYFAHPYHSWERGTNENTNGLIRQYWRKGTCLREVNQWKCRKIVDKLNRRPRKVLGGRSPIEELFNLTYSKPKDRALGLKAPRALLNYLEVNDKGKKTA
jgi:transposase, IS30 family